MVVKQPDKKETGQARETEVDVLHLQQHVPAKRGCYLHHQIGEHGHQNPAILRIPKRLDHLGAPVWIVINPIQDADRDAKLENRGQKLFHSPKRSFQIRTDWRIASAVLFGLISQTNKQFVGRSGTSLSKSIPPEKGASWSLAGQMQSCTWKPNAMEPTGPNHSA